MLPALDNFVAYGTETMVQNPSYLAGLIDMVQVIFQEEKVGGMDRICGCKLAESVMINLRGHVDQHIPIFVELAMNAILGNEPKVKSYRLHLMEMIINAIYYNTFISLQVLESNGWTNRFFSFWFSSIELFTRVHDKKLSIMAISSLLTLNADQVPRSVQQGWPRLLQGAVRLFQTLPAAIKSKASLSLSCEAEFFADFIRLDREEMSKEGDFQLNDDDDEEPDETWGPDEEWTNDGEEEAEGDVKDESAAYLDFLNEEVSTAPSAYKHQISG